MEAKTVSLINEGRPLCETVIAWRNSSDRKSIRKLKVRNREIIIYVELTRIAFLDSCRKTLFDSMKNCDSLLGWSF